VSAPGPITIRPYLRHPRAVPELLLYDSRTGEHSHVGRLYAADFATAAVQVLNNHRDELAAIERAIADGEPF